MKNLKKILLKMTDVNDLHSKFHALMVTLDDIMAGPIYLRDICNNTRPSNF